MSGGGCSEKRIIRAAVDLYRPKTRVQIEKQERKPVCENEVRP